MLHAKLRNRTCQGLDRQGQGQGQGLTSLSSSLKHAAACTANDITARRHLAVGLVDNMVEPADGFAGQFCAYRPENGQIASHQIEPR